MIITSVKINRKYDSATRLLGFASITLDSMIAIHDIKILDSENEGLFLGMPSRRAKTGVFKDCTHPINNETRQLFENIIMSAFKKCVEENKQVMYLELSKSMVEGNILRVNQSIDDFEEKEDPFRKQIAE